MSAAKQSIDCESCAYYVSCMSSEGDYGAEHDYECYVPDTPETKAFEIHCAIAAGDLEDDDDYNHVLCAVDSKVGWYRDWLKEHPYDFEQNCSEDYMISRILEEIIDFEYAKNHTEKELRSLIAQFIGALDFEETVNGRTYSFAKPVMV